VPLRDLQSTGKYAVQASRYRERHGVSGAKSDVADAHMLTDMVRTDSHQLRAVAGDSADAEGIKVLARTHKTLIWNAPGTSSGCGTNCGSTSPPRWKRSRTWPPLTLWSCWPRRPTLPGPRS